MLILAVLDGGYYIANDNFLNYCLIKFENTLYSAEDLIRKNGLAQRLLDQWESCLIVSTIISLGMRQRAKARGIKSLTKLAAVDVKQILIMISKEQHYAERRNYEAS